MSARRAVLEAVREVSARHGRAVTYEEVRRHLEPDRVPANLATAVGSLVRTGHLEALRAREWPRESRRLYAIPGSDTRVDVSVVPASISELVYGAVRSVFEAQAEPRRPISAAMVRKYLAGSAEGRHVLACPTYLPTALNMLRKPSREGPPLLQSVRLPGVRAQHWLPLGRECHAEVVWARDGTVADRLADLVVRASSLAADGLVSCHDIVWMARRFPDHRIAAADVPTVLADATRPVTYRGRRRSRAMPLVVRLGEVAGRALYAPTGGGWGKPEPADVAFRWRELAEAWSEADVLEELTAQEQLPEGSPWRLVRRKALTPTITRLCSRLTDLGGAPHPAEEVRDDRASLREAIRTAAERAGVLVHSDTVSRPVSFGVWLSAAEAGVFLRTAFGLVDDPPTIEAGFLADEVWRIRAIERGRPSRTSSRSRAEVWLYDRATLLRAGALRWAEAETGAMVSLGLELVGHVRSANALAPLRNLSEISITELCAAHAVLGDEDGRAFLGSVVACRDASTVAKLFAERGLRLLDWIRDGCEGRLWTR